MGDSSERIKDLLKAKDDTSRLVGLALLKSVLDNSSELRHDEAALRELWESISPRFLDRLLHAGTKSKDDSRHMMDISVAVLHTFVTLLPDEARKDARMTGRVPPLIPCLLTSSDETSRIILEFLLTLVSQSEGAVVFNQVEDLSPLTELAPSQPLALETLYYAWINAIASGLSDLTSKLDKTIGALLSSFKGVADIRPLLGFIEKVLRSVDSSSLPPNPAWLKPLVRLVHNIFLDNSIRSVFTDPATAARCAPYTNLSAALLQAYPVQVPRLLFSADTSSERPFPYLFITLLLVDLRSSFPSLLETLNTLNYDETARRLSSAFDIISSFIGHLVQSMDDESATMIMPVDLLLKLRKALSEAFAVTIQYLRDRWDASVAGAMGLHPDARAGVANPDTAPSHLTVAWDSMTDGLVSGADLLVLAAVRALAMWLRDDGNDMLCLEAGGLMDMFVELYKVSAGATGNRGDKTLDFRLPILIALEGILADERSVPKFLEEGGWEALAEDMLSILQATGSASFQETDALRGINIVNVLLPVARTERPGAREAWLDTATRVAAWDAPDEDSRLSAIVLEFLVAVLELVTVLLENVSPGMRRRYTHTKDDLIRTANRLLKGRARNSPEMADVLKETIETLVGLT